MYRPVSWGSGQTRGLVTQKSYDTIVYEERLQFSVRSYGGCAMLCLTNKDGTPCTQLLMIEDEEHGRQCILLYGHLANDVVATSQGDPAIISNS